MNQEFESLIRKDRDLAKAKAWKGNLLGYLEKVKENPGVTKLAHARLYDIMMKPGVRDIQDTDDPRIKRLYKDESVKVHDFFADEFFGIEKTIAVAGCVVLLTLPLALVLRAAIARNSARSHATV